LGRPGRAPGVHPEVRRPRVRPDLPPQRGPQPARVDRGLRPRGAPEARAMSEHDAAPGGPDDGAGPSRSARLTVWAPEGLGEVRPGDDLAAFVGDLLAGEALADGDVVVVTSKIVSKAEGRVVGAVDQIGRASCRERENNTGVAE